MILLAHTPFFLLKKLIKNYPAKRWIYLGQDHHFPEKIARYLSCDCREIIFARELYASAENSRAHFAEWVDNFSGGMKKSTAWISCASSVKNVYSSQLFLNINYFFVFKELNQKDKIDLVFVDSAALAHLISDHFSFLYPPVNCLGELIIFLKGFIRSLLRWGKCILEFMRRYAAAKIVFKRDLHDIFKVNTDLVLIRNYVTGDFRKDAPGLFEKHFFPKVDAFLEAKGYHVVFLSVPYQVKSYRALFKEILRSKKKILCPEELFNFFDFLYALLAPVRAFFFFLKPQTLRGIDLTSLLKEDYFSNLTQSDFLYSILLSRVGRLLKDNNCLPCAVIQWSEFQSFEKGLIVGLREAYPSLEIIGSQPFLAPPNHMSLIPSRQDVHYKVMPDRLLVLGPASRQLAQSFVKNFEISYTPAFRYRSLWQPLPVKRGNDVLILLGYGLSNAVVSLRQLLEIKEHLKFFHQISIKLHPAGYFNEKRLVRALGQNLPSYFKFVGGKLEELLPNVAMGICGATGTSVELVLRGIPVIVLAEQKALTMNYLYDRDDPGIWRMCFDENEIQKAIVDFRQMLEYHIDELNEKAVVFRRRYFIEPQEAQWENYCPRKQHI